jgi:hypothetical protein
MAFNSSRSSRRLRERDRKRIRAGRDTPPDAAGRGPAVGHDSFAGLFPARDRGSSRTARQSGLLPISPHELEPIVPTRQEPAPHAFGVDDGLRYLAPTPILRAVSSAKRYWITLPSVEACRDKHDTSQRFYRHGKEEQNHHEHSLNRQVAVKPAYRTLARISRLIRFRLGLMASTLASPGGAVGLSNGP